MPLPATALSEAFVKARWEAPDPNEQLFPIGIEAWIVYPNDAPARRVHVVNCLRSEQTFKLIELTNKSQIALSVGWLLNKTEPMYKARLAKDTGGQSVGGGQNRADIQDCLAPAVSFNSAVEQKIQRDERKASELRVLSKKHRERTLSGIAMQVHLSKLDTFKIYGLPLRNYTPWEALAWASVQKRNARFIELITDKLPPNELIGKNVSPERADKLFAQAEAERHAIR